MVSRLASPGSWLIALTLLFFAGSAAAQVVFPLPNPICEAAIERVAADYNRCLARGDTRHLRDESATRLERRQASCERRFERGTARITGDFEMGECPEARNPLEPRLGDKLNEMFKVDLTLLGEVITIAKVGNIVHVWDNTERLDYPWVPAAGTAGGGRNVDHNQHLSSSSFINDQIYDRGPDGTRNVVLYGDPPSGGIVWGGDALAVGCVYTSDGSTIGSKICSCAAEDLPEFNGVGCTDAYPKIDVYLQGKINEACPTPMNPNGNDPTTVCSFSYCTDPAVKTTNGPCPLIPNNEGLRFQQEYRKHHTTLVDRYGEVAVLFSQMELDNPLSVNYLTKVQAFWVNNVAPQHPRPDKPSPLYSCKVWKQMQSSFPIGSIGPDLYRLNVFDSSSAPWELIAVWENADTFDCNSITFQPLVGQ